VSSAAVGAEMTTSVQGGRISLQQQRATVQGALGLAGFRMGTGRVNVALEAAGGMRNAHYVLVTTNGDEAHIAAEDDIIEARARAELGMLPHVSFTGTWGANVLQGGDWMAGMFIGLHSRAFAGSR
jgi:hypothetical protein